MGQLTDEQLRSQGPGMLSTVGNVASLAALPIQAYGAIEGIKEQRKNRRFQVQQYLIEKEARARAQERDRQQQELTNTLALGNYGQNQAQSAMDIFGNYNRTIGR
jgi:hypothetical protein